tara:strand:+ start:1628 stop:2494 length:867 start_codon:yes stop_codon:yes gene_type:complete
MDITVFIVDGGEEKKSVVGHKRKHYYNAEDVLAKEMQQYDISGNIVKLDPEEPLPHKTESNLNLILDTSLMVKEDTINHLISLNNMFRTAGIFCGPVYQKVEEISQQNPINDKMHSSYYSYDLNFGGTEVCNISKDINSYPNLVGCCVTKEAYNNYIINPLIKSRFYSRDNRMFISKISERYDLIYSKGFSKIKNLTTADFSITAVSNYYYNLGFQDGSVLASKNADQKQLEIWRRFVSSPELLDNELPRWLFRVTAEEGSEHLEQLVLLKCKYQIGFYEGMLGKNVL